MSKIEYDVDVRQTTKGYRKQSGIKAFKILAVDGNKLTFRLPNVFGKNKSASIELANKLEPDKHIVGSYIDLILQYAAYEGRATSYQVSYIGLTPLPYIPTSGEEIGR